MNTALVVFDMDGVIIDSEPFHEIVHNAIIEELSEGRVFLPNIHGLSTDAEYQMLLDMMPEIKLTTKEISKRHFEKVWETIREKDPGPMKGFYELKSAIERAGIPYAVASSSPKAFVENVLKYVGIDPESHIVMTGDTPVTPKPAPDIYLAVADKAGAAPEKTVAIEDSSLGIQAAKNAGLFCFAVKTEGQDQSIADKVVASLDEIIPVLGL